MSNVVVKDFKELARVFNRDMRKLDERGVRACRRAVQRTAAHLRRNIPVAFGDLRNSVREEGMKLIVDAPHAAAVEYGSRPHWAPLEPLIKWVKLRGFQSLAVRDGASKGADGRYRDGKGKFLNHLTGTTTVEHATRVGEQLANTRRGGPIGPERSSTALSAPIEIAKSIQLAIALRGTKPQFYMANSIPLADKFLGEEFEKLAAEAFA
jgi:hypothetical protein